MQQFRRLRQAWIDLGNGLRNLACSDLFALLPLLHTYTTYTFDPGRERVIALPYSCNLSFPSPSHTRLPPTLLQHRGSFCGESRRTTQCWTYQSTCELSPAPKLIPPKGPSVPLDDLRAVQYRRPIIHFSTSTRRRQPPNTSRLRQKTLSNSASAVSNTTSCHCRSSCRRLFPIFCSISALLTPPGACSLHGPDVSPSIAPRAFLPASWWHLSIAQIQHSDT